MFLMLYWMICWKSMFLHQNFRLNLPPSELNKWTIVIIHNDAEFAEDQFGTKIFYLCHWKSWENHTHRLCENLVDFVRRWTLEKILQTYWLVYPLFLTPLINAVKIDEARRASRVRLAGPAVESYAGYLTVNQVDCGSNLVKNDNAKPYLSSPIIFLACMIISHITIDHRIIRGFFMTLKWVKSALKGIIQK